MRIPLASALSIAVAISGLALGRARGERSPNAGIGIDVEIARVLSEIERENAHQKKLDGELSALEVRRSQLQTELKTRVRALYRVTRDGIAPIGGGFEAIQRHVARLRRLRSLVVNDQKAYVVAQARAKAARDELALAQSSLGRARQRLTALQGEQSMTAALEPKSDSGDRETSVSAIRSGNAFYGLRFTDEPVARRSDFDAQRGKLAAPVTGEVRVLDGRRAESEGLEFQAAPSTPVRAAAAGRVAFADRHGSYGRLVILDHGGGYHTLYGGLGELDVRVGDDVSPYARLGTIGDAGDESSLFFEVRRGSHALPPRPWLGL